MIHRRIVGTTLIVLATVFAWQASFADDQVVNDPSALVEVDHAPYEIVPGQKNKIIFAPYADRRTEFGASISFGASQYVPAYVKNGLSTTGDPVSYTSSQANLMEATFSPQWNFSLGSLSLDLGAGAFSIPTTAGAGTGTSLTMYRAGITYTMNHLWPEPYVAPYFSGGVYQISYNESVNGNSASNLTGAAPYVAAGIALQLNWIEKTSSRYLYDESGIENTYAYLEARSLLAGDPIEPNFSSAMALGAGLRLEF